MRHTARLVDPEGDGPHWLTEISPPAMDHTDPDRRSLSALITPLVIASALLIAVTACGSEANGDSGGAAADAPIESGVAAAIDAGELAVVEPSIDRPVNPSIAAVRLTIANGTDDPDALVGVSSPDGEATIHRSDVDEEGRSTMTAVERLDLPARSSVVFEPGGLHVMITGITRDLAVGDTVSVTFELEAHEPLVVDVPVVDPLSGSGDIGTSGADPDADEHDHAALGPTTAPTTTTPGALR